MKPRYSRVTTKIVVTLVNRSNARSNSLSNVAVHRSKLAESLAETRAPRIRWIWYRGRAIPSLLALTVTEKHVIVLKSIRNDCIPWGSKREQVRSEE